MFWFVTLGLATISVGAVSILARRVVTVAAFYWVGWLLGIAAATTMSGDGLMPPFGAPGKSLILRLNLGACLGFVLAAVVYHVVVVAVLGPRALLSYQRDRAEQLYISPGVLRTVLILQLVLGLGLLGFRMQEAGGFAGVNSLVNLRASFLESTYLANSLSFPLRLATHLGLVLSAFPFLLALQDALAGRPNTRRLFYWWLASAPGGLSSGGRGWIISVPALYAFGYLVSSASVLTGTGARRLGRRACLAALGMVALFGVIERFRSRESISTLLFETTTGTRWYHAWPSLIPVVYYLGLPSLAVGEHAALAQGMGRHEGSLTFPFFTAQLHRMGVSVGRGSLLEFTQTVRSRAFLGRYPVLGATHATMIPGLIGDFGTAWVLPAMGIICFLMELAFLFLRRRGIVRRFIAVQIAMFGGFWVFQEFSLGQAGAVLPVAWLLGLVSLAVLSNPDPQRRWLRFVMPQPLPAPDALAALQRGDLPP